MTTTVQYRDVHVQPGAVIRDPASGRPATTGMTATAGAARRSDRTRLPGWKGGRLTDAIWVAVLAGERSNPSHSRCRAGHGGSHAAAADNSGCACACQRTRQTLHMHSASVSDGPTAMARTPRQRPQPGRRCARPAWPRAAALTTLTLAVLLAVLLASRASTLLRDGRTVQDGMVRAGAMWVLLPTRHGAIGDRLRHGWRWYVQLCHGQPGTAQLTGRRHPVDCSSLVTDAGHAVGAVQAFNRPSAPPGSPSTRRPAIPRPAIPRPARPGTSG